MYIKLIKYAVLTTVLLIAPPGLSASPISEQISLWNQIKESQDINDFVDYLNKYPDGIFASMAMAKRRELAKGVATEDLPDNSSPATAAVPAPVVNPQSIIVAAEQPPESSPGLSTVTESVSDQVTSETELMSVEVDPASTSQKPGQDAESALPVTTEAPGMEASKSAEDDVVYKVISMEPVPTEITASSASTASTADKVPTAIRELTTNQVDPQPAETTSDSSTVDLQAFIQQARETVAAQDQGTDTGVTSAKAIDNGRSVDAPQFPTTADPSGVMGSSDVEVDVTASANDRVVSESDTLTTVTLTPLESSTESQNSAFSEPVTAQQPQVSEFLKRYIKAAETGNVKAQLSLGYMYENGEQADQNTDEAIRWYQMAAEQGDVQAQLALALIYENLKDPVTAADWYRQSALKGNADAQQALGYYYESGTGVPKSMAAAAAWYERAAEQGMVAAQNNLGRLYQLGIGVDKNLDKAIYWYEQAAAQGSETAKGNLQELLP